MPARVGFIGISVVNVDRYASGRSADPVHPAHGLALDLHVVHFLPATDDRFKGGILGPQLDVVAVQVYPLECSFIPYSHSSDLAILHLRLDADMPHENA